MVDICMSTDTAEGIWGIDETFRLAREAGFKAVDVGFFSSIVKREDVKNQTLDPKWLVPGEEFDKGLFDPYKEAAQKYGLDVFQAHSLFPSLVPAASDEYNQGLVEAHKKMIAACDYIGCRRLVIHPFYYDYECNVDPKKEWETNISSYFQLAETAKKHNVQILLENMLTAYKGRKYEACCSDLTEACKYVDTLNEMAGCEIYGFCLDTGHLHCLCKDQKKWLVGLGSRIKALHVHDNDGIKDQHIAPYTGSIDWNRFIEGLRECGYHDTINFESINIFKNMAPEAAIPMMRVVYETGVMFAQKAGL